MQEIAPFRSRAAFTDAETLIERFGAGAASEAARLAGRSRDLGNLIHFCRWREARRMIDLLSDAVAAGPLH